MKRVDFHTHTTCSDGVMTPQALAKDVVEADIRMWAITDHDDIRGYDEVQGLLPDGFEIFSGAEFSTGYAGKDIHVLGYGFDRSYAPLAEYISFFKEKRRNRFVDMLKRCAEEGIDLPVKTIEDVWARYGDGAALGRPHLALLLIEAGYADTIAKAFSDYLKPGGPLYVPKFKTSPEEVVSLVHDAGGLVVLAHPVLINDDAIAEELLKLPFDGLEVYHSKQNEEDRARYLAMANRHGLLASGGSDYHGTPGRYPVRIGEYELYEDVVTPFIQALKSL